MKKLFILVIFVLLSGCVTEESLLVQEYNTRLERLDLMFDEHQKFGEEIEKNFAEPELHKETLDKYIKWVGENREFLEEFKLFIEINYKELREEGKDPVYVRDIIKILLEDVEDNEEFFKRCNMIWDRYREK